MKNKGKIKEKEMKGFESSNEICSLALKERINACVRISARAIMIFFPVVRLTKQKQIILITEKLMGYIVQI